MIIKIRFLIIVSTLFLLACGSENNEQVIKDDIKFDEISNYNKEQIKTVAYNMPSPMQAALILKEADAIYMTEMMNPVGNEVNYANSSYVTALNLGVYGADLGYACAYTNVEDAFAYLRVARNLAESLGILGAFENEMIARFDKNLDNQDSIMAIVGESFQLSDEFLKENERANISALIVAGGWIEGLYLSTKIVDKYPINMNEEKRKQILTPITRSIAEQKPSLTNLISLLDVHKENKDIKRLIRKLRDLEKTYKGVTYEELSYNVQSSDEGGSTNISNETKVEMHPRTLAQITLIIHNIRNSLTHNIKS